MSLEIKKKRLGAAESGVNMKSIIVISIVLSALTGVFISCTAQSSDSASGEAADASLGITPVPETLGWRYRAGFKRYTKVTAPNGKPIHIVAKSGITNEQILRCRGILEHYLRDYPGSLYGSDKSGVADSMANNGAVLLLMNGRDGSFNKPFLVLRGQPLYQEEIQVEGGEWYVRQDYENHRDAAFEEILHLVHDYGIGVDAPRAPPGAAPDFQKEIRAAQAHALENGLWGQDGEWIEELGREGSLTQEYLAALIDSYYGLWGAWPEPYGMWGEYAAQTRVDIPLKDPEGEKLLENKFFHPYLTYNARIDAGFQGIFSLRFDPGVPYSHHSRYLKDITLLGSYDTKVRVNELNNDITGNQGVNTVIFTGNMGEYSVETTQGVSTVSDGIASRDGINTLRNIERLEFADQVMDLTSDSAG